MPRLNGKPLPVLVEILPDVFLEQHQMSGIAKRYPRRWMPRVVKRKYKPRAKK